MTDLRFQVLRAAGFAVAVAIAVALQRLRPHVGVDRSPRVNVSLWLTNLVVVAALCGACACTVARWAASANVGVLNVARLPAWLGVVATIGALDFVSYAWHRANHRVRFLWRFHQVHHSDPHYTASTAARFHPGEIMLSLPIRLSAVAALGASPLGVVVFEIVFALSNFFEHGDIDLPLVLEKRLGRVLVVPALHRRHHSRKPRELNTNFGTVLIVWDRMLGTYGRSTSNDIFAIGLPCGQQESRDSRFGDAFLLPLRLTSGWQQDREQQG
jgi:sterol desaturase/sphingolipid hydroxylase (fatty acid hydroxylase superfamily)